LERFHWDFLWADRDAQFAGHAENVANESADWKNARKYFFRVLGAWRLNLAVARRRYAQRLSQKFLRHPIVSCPSPAKDSGQTA
jgi:hypothetical protein